MSEHKELVRRDGQGNVEFFHEVMGFEYAVNEKEFCTRRGLIRWVGQLCEKNWITPEHIQQLIHISSKIVAEPFKGE